MLWHFISATGGVASNLTTLFSSFHVFSGSSKIGIIIASILSAIALSMFALFGALLGYKRISQKKKGTFLSKIIHLSSRTFLSFTFF